MSVWTFHTAFNHILLLKLPQNSSPAAWLCSCFSPLNRAGVIHEFIRLKLRCSDTWCLCQAFPYQSKKEMSHCNFGSTCNLLRRKIWLETEEFAAIEPSVQLSTGASFVFSFSRCLHLLMFFFYSIIIVRSSVSFQEFWVKHNSDSQSLVATSELRSGCWTSSNPLINVGIIYIKIKDGHACLYWMGNPTRISFSYIWSVFVNEFAYLI